MNAIRFRGFMLSFCILLRLDACVTGATVNSLPSQRTEEGFVNSESISNHMKELLEKADADINLPLILTSDDGNYELADPYKRKKSNDFLTYNFLYKNNNLEVFCPSEDGKAYKTNYSNSSLLLKTKITSHKRAIRSSKYRCSSPLIPSVTPIDELSINSTSCTIYSVGYQVFNNGIESKNTTDLPKNYEWFSLYQYCFDVENLNAIHANEIVAYQDIIPEEKSIITIDAYLRSGVTEKYDMENLYSLKNQEKIFRELFSGSYSKYFDTLRDVYLEKQELIDQKNHMLPTWKIGTLYYMNVAPMYKSIKDGSWKRQAEFIRSKFKEDLTLLIFNGTYETLHIQGKPIRLNTSKRNFLRVPEIFYKIVTIKLFVQIRSMAIVTRNNPFVDPTDEENICDEPIDCEAYGWEVASTDRIYGYTYCCVPTQYLESKLRVVNFPIGNVLNLNNLQQMIQIERKLSSDETAVTQDEIDLLDGL